MLVNFFWRYIFFFIFVDQLLSQGQWKINRWIAKLARRSLISKHVSKGQITSKANCQDRNSSKKQRNEFVFTSMRRIFVCFFEEIEVTKNTFWNYRTCRAHKSGKNNLEITSIATNSLSCLLNTGKFWQMSRVDIVWMQIPSRFNL